METYIDYFNKDNNFKITRKKFKDWQSAKKWALKNFEKFDPDMIGYL